MLKVCHIASGDLWAGAEVQVANLVAQLRKDPSIELALLVMNEGPLAEQGRQAGVLTEVLDERSHGFRTLIGKTKAFVRGFQPDILHSHRYKENVLAAIARSAAGSPALVRTQHGMPEPFARGASLQHRVSLLADRFVARRMTNRIIAVSSDMHRELARIYPAQKIALIPNGIDADALAHVPAKTQARARLGIAAEVPLIGYCGRLEPVKRIDLFLDAAKLLREQNSNAKFVVAGDGNERSRLEQRAKALDLRENIVFLGHRSDVAVVLRALDILSLTSDHEGLPMVLLEALAAGTLVVAREVGGIPEVILHEQNGLLVMDPSPQAIAGAWQRALALDAATKRAWSEAGVRTVRERFSAKGNAEAMSALYREVLR
jgi:glycosyltransferase involved in cell wall biosynthesis